MGSIIKKMIIAAIGAAASYYATKSVTAALERKPLKTRVRDGKAKAVDIKDSVVNKAVEAKAAATGKVDALINGVEDTKKDGE